MTSFKHYDASQLTIHQWFYTNIMIAPITLHALPVVTHGSRGAWCTVNAATCTYLLSAEVCQFADNEGEDTEVGLPDGARGLTLLKQALLGMVVHLCNMADTGG